jgi:hypothetical protein
MGDLFVLTAPPRKLGAKWSAPGVVFRAVRMGGGVQGGHGYDPRGLPEMNGILLALGRGVPPGFRPGVVSSLDVAPTVTRLLGIEPPRDCEGSPITGVGGAPAGEAAR